MKQDSASFTFNDIVPLFISFFRFIADKRFPLHTPIETN